MKKMITLLAALVFGVMSAAEMPNVLKNGSFEEGLDAKGAPKGWRTEYNSGVDGVIELSDKHVAQGKKSLHLNKKNAKGSIYVQQDIRLKPNTEYILEAKGFRTATYRYHVLGIRQPDTRNQKETKIPDKGGAVKPIRFRTDPKKTLTYIYIGLWCYSKDNDKASIGEMWIDNITLREVPAAKK